MGNYSNLEWRKNARGKWAWFDGNSQVSGASELECDSGYVYDAECMHISYPRSREIAIQVRYYETWYSEYSKSLALNYSKDELEKMISKKEKQIPSATESHLRAIEKSGSMQGNSQHRAKTRQVVDAIAEERNSLRCALEIYDFFPEHTKSAQHRLQADGLPRTV